MNQHVLERIQSPGPKKILACDGGGIRGLMTVEILADLEDKLRKKREKPDLLLSDYFDFVCGTSTGAIIAAGISAGMSMSAIREFYLDSGAEMFDKASIFKRLKYKYDDEPLAQKLQSVLNSALGHREADAAATLGDTNLCTLLMMVMRNHSTDSPWPVTNNPGAKYNQYDRKDCNLKLPLWQLVRASTAAPTFFPPEVVTFAEGTSDEYSFVFLDGGVTTYNNPAFLAFEMATASPYKINWKPGVDELLIVSVGTGQADSARPDVDADDLWLLNYATSMPDALMNSAASGWDMACRTLGHCRFGAKIDNEFGSMVVNEGDGANWSGSKLFSYVRYNPELSAQGLSAIGLPDIDPAAIRALDSVKNMGDLQRVGQAYARENVSLSHLGSFAA